MKITGNSPMQENFKFFYIYLLSSWYIAQLPTP